MTIATSQGKKLVNLSLPQLPTNNAIQEELIDFYKAIKDNSLVKVDAADGYRAIKLAHQIDEIVKQTSVF